jgi:hypothetical protein
MTETATPRPAILRRVLLSTAAWRLLCESTSTSLGLPPGPADQAAGTSAGTPLDEKTEAEAWTELHTLGMSPAPGEVKRQWTGAVALLLTAPITVTARATYNGVSTTSVLGLRAGRGLAVHQRHVSERSGHDTVITGSEDSMEVTLFDEENVWGATARLLPPLDAVQAPAKAAPMDGKPSAVLEAGTDPTSLPPEDANITLGITTTAPGLPPRIWAGMWSVQGATLYSVTTGTDDAPEVRLTEVPAGHIANELIFAVVGAHDALGGAGKAARGNTASESGAL